MSYFKGKVYFISGASRGIGKAIALRLAREGAAIIIAAKSVTEDPRLGGTIYTAAEAITQAGGKAFPIRCDIRDEPQTANAIQQGAMHFGGIDGIIHNASAINLAGTGQMEMKRFSLLYDINVRGTFQVTKYAIPWLRQAANPHILTLSPPLNMDPAWFGSHAAYTISKYSMSMLTTGWAIELKKDGIAANALWPMTTIATAAIRNMPGGEQLMRKSRNPEILADAAFYILRRPAASCTGNHFLDEAVLHEEGITMLDQYAVTPGGELQKDFFIP